MKKFFVPIICLCLLFALPSCDPNDDDDNNDNNDSTKTEEEVFVNKTAQTRNVLLEEFTGVKCGWCPVGHKMTDSLYNLYKGHCFHMNIHAGSYANTTPNYTTNDGDSIYYSFFDAGFFPSGMTGRIYWSMAGVDTGFCFHPNYFPSLTAQTMTMPAYVNVAAKTTINASTRKLTCNVQAYFTGSPTNSSTKNIVYLALIQSNIKGPQSGATKYPAMWDGTNYTHNHMFRAFINTPSGTIIPTNTQGTLYKQTFTFDIPSTLGNGNIPVVLDDLDVIVYVTEKVDYNGRVYGFPVINVNESSMTVK